ncbi:MAG TPA: hypothetical protein VMO54_08310 [Steroidobacteraceae bacterium]|nr:hypothetical protein [Steroidobacteraceae bacterium]
MQEIIAERRLLYCQKGTSERRELVIRVGCPYWQQDNVAACPLSWDGLFENMTDIQGADLFTSLTPGRGR